jgi:hypothetical protein
MPQKALLKEFDILFWSQSPVKLHHLTPITHYTLSLQRNPAPLFSGISTFSKVHELHPSGALTQHNNDTMVVKIRLARFGRRKAPFYNIVVAQARSVSQ